MINDEVIAELRRIREELAEQFHGDVRAIDRFIAEQQAGSGREYVRLSPRPPRIRKTRETAVQDAG